MDAFLQDFFLQAPLITAFIAGILSFVSPCVLPLLPAYISYISGQSLGELKSKKPTLMILLQSILFIIGFGIIFVLIGASIAKIIDNFQTQWLRYVSGGVVILFGLHFLGLFKFSFLYKTKNLDLAQNQKKFNKFLSPILLGMSLSLGWSPCIGPIFTSIILLGSFQANTALVLLGVYVLGFGVPFLLLSLLLSRAFKFLNFIKKHFRKIEVVSGILLILVGIFIMIPGSESWFL
ncbi:MAG: cytochrome c biogenesis protein CcdA [Helicobacter sp.]|nr:cytochrome c biogenesis protein CcdA [Helicobacter sp.]